MKSVVVYKCDTCDREVTIPRDIEGLEHIGKCNATLGCRGSLIQQKVINGSTRGIVTTPVTGLDDWYPRKVLHEHDQVLSSDEWVIVHKFGTEPSVIAYIDDPVSGEQIEKTPTDIDVIDKDTVVVYFDAEYSGIAQLIARQSDPNLFNPIVEPADSTTDNISRLTVLSEFSIATRISTLGDAANIRIKVTYVTDGSVLSIIYNVDDQPSANSPWSDYNKVSMKGKVYTVRSFNFITPEMGRGGSVSEGSNVFFAEVDKGDGLFIALNKDDIILLIADSPYQGSDKNRNIYINAEDTAIDRTALFFSNQNIFAVKSIIRTIYPPIRFV